jgi:hypothetical protein
MMKNRLFKSKLKFNFFSKTKYFFNTLTPGQNTGVSTPPPRKHGNLKDSDRIFTNVYRDGDPFIEGAMKRVKLI